MVHAPTNKQKQKLRGIRAAARKLNVDHSHLSRVLRGIRESRSLTARYQALIEQEAGR